ncbi:MAG TPA: hypothetical protein VG938_06195 [Verrucomicrobiae bacterium]|jgi:hypothetical protein|nr:hypothetical protein [Verrucomicrobiae bacterium]
MSEEAKQPDNKEIVVANEKNVRHQNASELCGSDARLIKEGLDTSTPVMNTLAPPDAPPPLKK